MSVSGAPTQQHPPYPPTTAGLGGSPTKTLDDPITSVFLVLFVLGAVIHMTIFQVNRRRGHKFIISGMLFGFCMARTVTCTMRLVWSTHLTNISVAIAAQVFVSAGVLLLFIVNLIFAQRMLRASNPHWAWARWLSVAFKLYYASIVLMLVALITCTVQSFFTLSHNTRRIDHDVQLVGATYFAVSAFLPIPLVILRYLLPNKVEHVDKFGSGKFRTKIRVLLFSSIILTLGAAFRAGTAYVPRPRNDPAWYDSKACFYIFNFTIEIIVVLLYAAIRVDLRFHIPNGVHGPGTYSAGRTGMAKNELHRSKDELHRSKDELHRSKDELHRSVLELHHSILELHRSILDRINTEEETFDGQPVDENVEKKTGDIESWARPVAAVRGRSPEIELQPLRTSSSITPTQASRPSVPPRSPNRLAIENEFF